MQGTWFATLAGEKKIPHASEQPGPRATAREFMAYGAMMLRPDAAKLKTYIFKTRRNGKERRKYQLSTPPCGVFQPQKGTSGLYPQHTSELLDAGQLCMCVFGSEGGYCLLEG